MGCTGAVANSLLFEISNRLGIFLAHCDGSDLGPWACMADDAVAISERIRESGFWINLTHLF